MYSKAYSGLWQLLTRIYKWAISVTFRSMLMSTINGLQGDDAFWTELETDFDATGLLVLFFYTTFSFYGFRILWVLLLSFLSLSWS